MVARGVFFFFQAEDGIRDLTVTGVQTCALPICSRTRRSVRPTAQAGGAVSKRTIPTNRWCARPRTSMYGCSQRRYPHGGHTHPGWRPAAPTLPFLMKPVKRNHELESDGRIEVDLREAPRGGEAVRQVGVLLHRAAVACGPSAAQCHPGAARRVSRSRDRASRAL